LNARRTNHDRRKARRQEYLYFEENRTLGYGHTPQRFATAADSLCATHLNPYLHLHRPCLFTEEIAHEKGKIGKRYPQRLVMKSFEKLATFDRIQQHLCPALTLETLSRLAATVSDNDAAARLNDARSQLFLSIQTRSTNAS
jgi:hypothetical protein